MTPFNLVLDQSKITDLLHDSTNTTSAGFLSPVENPKDILVLISGGYSPYKFSKIMDTLVVRQDSSFMWNWIPHWFNEGYAVVVIDTHINFYVQAEMPAMFRHTNTRLTAITDIIKQVKEKYIDSNVFAYGHSFGSIEASRLAGLENVVDKVVLGAGVWNPVSLGTQRSEMGFIKDFNPVIPVLIAHHKLDQTSLCLYHAVEPLLEQYPSIIVTNDVEHEGNPGFDPGPHFWKDKEAEVASNISKWLKGLEYQSIID